MSELPTVPIILVTSTRTTYAERTIAAMRNHLRYDGRLVWYIAADNSNEQHRKQVQTAVMRDIRVLFVDRKVIVPGSSPTLLQTIGGYGVAANEAWRECSERGWPITFWLEDDWMLRRDLDITPQVRLLMEREDIGCVRYSYLPTDLELDSVGHDFRMYLQIRKTRPYAFSGNPHLKHDRFKFYGEYPEGQNPGDTEIHYDGQIRHKPHEGPSIWWVLGIGDDPPFQHIGEEQSY